MFVMRIMQNRQKQSMLIIEAHIHAAVAESTY